MKAFVPNYKLVTLNTLQETLNFIWEHKTDVRPFAGGTDLMVQYEAGFLPEKIYLNLMNLPELKGISFDKDCVKIGATTTYSDIIKNKQICSEFPLLEAAAKQTGAKAIQNRGTIGGNLCNASPAADTPPALLVYDAELELISVDGVRNLPIADFFLGYKKTAIKPNEIIKSVKIKKAQGFTHQIYHKVGTRKAQAISKICLALGVQLEKSKKVSKFKLALGSVGPTTILCQKIEKQMVGKTLDATSLKTAVSGLASEITPIDDIRSTGKYRLKVAQNLLQDFLEGMI